MRLRFGLAIAALLFHATLVFGQDNLLFGIPQIPVPGLPDIAIASYSPGGPVIYFNPGLAQQLSMANPGMLKFILAHEYGHHKLGHIKKQMYAGGNYFLRMQIAQQGEIEADMYATEYWVEHDPSVINGAIAFMSSPYTANWGDQTHLPTPKRAQLIIQRANQLFAKLNGQGEADSAEIQYDSESQPTKPFSYFVAKSRNGVKQFIAGPDVTGLGIWDSSILFPGASSTEVQRESGEYSLEAYFKRNSVMEAKRTFDELLALARADLGEAWKYDVSRGTMSGSRIYWKANITNLLHNVNVEIRFMEMRSGKHKVTVSFIPH